jgi:DNA helicase HerA-like ATPase
VADNHFRGEPGRLMKVDLDNMAGYRYEIWFPYTQDMMGNVRPGDLVAIPNFGAREGDNRQTVLEIIQVLPKHFALGGDLEGVYPGFMDQAAESASQDWTNQVDKATEQTTKIRCIAIPTDIEVGFNKSNGSGPEEVAIHSEAQMPMPGKEARMLSSTLIQQIYNQNLGGNSTIELGTLTRDKTVPIKARVEDLIKTHVGIFGYTGTGKSNLLSSFISSLLSQNQENVKVVVFDLMGEYTGLLLDRLLDKSTNQFPQLVAIGEESLPGPVVKYLKGDTSLLDEAASSLLNHLLLPKGLKTRKQEFRPAVKELLQSGRIKFYLKMGGETVRALYEGSPVADFINDSRRNSTDRAKLRQWAESAIGDNMDSSVTPKVAKEIAASLEEGVDELSDRAQEAAKFLIESLEEKSKAKESSAAPQTYVPAIAGELNKEDRNSLFIITAAQPDLLRQFSNYLCMAMYNDRRQRGAITPLTLFVFDEADEFIPQNPKDSYEQSSDAVETIARRGRKFGMGVCIATQRIAYLDTSILAQPHTYFVSRLPREYDRQAVTSAFGMSEDMMRETFRFGKGDWLVVSHDATGLQSVPIPVHAPNAEERIKQNLLSAPSG